MGNAKWEEYTPEYIYVTDSEIKCNWEINENMTGYECFIWLNLSYYDFDFASDEEAQEWLEEHLNPYSEFDFWAFSQECDHLQLYADGSLRLTRYV